MRTAIFVSNRAFGLARSRLPLMRALKDRGWNVVAACAPDESVSHFAANQIGFCPVTFARRAFAPLSDIVAVARLRSIYREYQPQLVHHFNAKPVVLGQVAVSCSAEARPRVFSTITGLGYAFSAGGLAGRAAALGFRTALPQSSAVIFQNRDDLVLALERGWVGRASARLIVSSGVDTRLFTPEGNQRNAFQTVLFIGRLLRQKGIGDFIEVARRVRANNPSVRFEIGGETEPKHCDSFPAQVLREAIDAGLVHFSGYVRNVPAALRACSILLAPSYYREGVPRVVLEAAASGVPVIGADVPGTREAIVDGVTGYLVAPGDVAAMTSRVEELLADQGKRAAFGRAARELMEREFDTAVVTERYLQLYKDVLGNDV